MEIILCVGIAILVVAIIKLARENRDLWNLIDDLDE